jgi:hypothetical protein
LRKLKGQSNQGCSILKNSNIIEEMIYIHAVLKKFRSDILNLVE